MGSILHLLHGEMGEILKAKAIAIKWDEPIELVFDGFLGIGIIDNDKHTFDSRIYLQGNVQGLLETDRFYHPGNQRVVGDRLLLEIVDPAKNNRGAGEEVLLVAEKKGKGSVVGGDENVKSVLAVFVPIQIGKVFQVLFIGNPFGIHVFKLDSNRMRVFAKSREDASGNAVGPFKALVIRVEHQDSLRCFQRCCTKGNRLDIQHKGG
jgi:hypothetical protein